MFGYTGWSGLLKFSLYFSLLLLESIFTGTVTGFYGEGCTVTLPTGALMGVLLAAEGTSL